MYKIKLYILYQYLVARSSIITNRVKSFRTLVSAVRLVRKNRRPTFIFIAYILPYRLFFEIGMDFSVLNMLSYTHNNLSEINYDYAYKRIRKNGQRQALQFHE